MFMGVKAELVVTGLESARRVTKGPEAVKQSRRAGTRGKGRKLHGLCASCLSRRAFVILRGMSIRKAGGHWEPMMSGIEPRNCKVCKQGLYRNKTFFTGGWSRCALCDEFVHYSCLASGKVSFLKARPRVCKTCRIAQEGIPAPSTKEGTPVAVGS